MAVQVLWEVDAEMQLEIQEIYLRQCLEEGREDREQDQLLWIATAACKRRGEGRRIGEKEVQTEGPI